MLNILHTKYAKRRLSWLHRPWPGDKWEMYVPSELAYGEGGSSRHGNKAAGALTCVEKPEQPTTIPGVTNLKRREICA